jgi:hypothetical protein
MRAGASIDVESRRLGSEMDGASRSSTRAAREREHHPLIRQSDGKCRAKPLRALRIAGRPVAAVFEAASRRCKAHNGAGRQAHLDAARQQPATQAHHEANSTNAWPQAQDADLGRVDAPQKPIPLGSAVERAASAPGPMRRRQSRPGGVGNVDIAVRAADKRDRTPAQGGAEVGQARRERWELFKMALRARADAREHQSSPMNAGSSSSSSAAGPISAAATSSQSARSNGRPQRTVPDG